jgi:hypothetical protein
MTEIDLPPYVHRKIAKGRPYYYYSLRRVGANRCQLVRLPDITDPKFERRLHELHSLRGVPEDRRNRKTRNGAAAVVYFIGGNDGPIKIGVSCDPQARCDAMQIGHPDEVRVLATTPGGRRLEQAYHERFGFARLRGEWFERHPLLMAEIHRLNMQGTKGDVENVR